MADAGARWALIAGLYAAVATGCFYGFSVYSLSLKAQCGLSQSALSNINTLPYGLGVLSPLIVAAGRPLGARGMMFVGGTIEAVAMILQYLIATHCDGAIRAAAPVLLVLCSCLTYIGVQLVTSVAFPTPVAFWPINRSQVTATVKSFVGLGGAAVAQTYRVLYGAPTENPVALRCLLMWAGISFIGAVFGGGVLPRKASSAVLSSAPEPRRALNTVFGEVALLGLAATATPLFPDGWLHLVLVLVMWVLALLPVPLALLVGRPTSKTVAALITTNSDSLLEPQLNAIAQANANVSDASDASAVGVSSTLVAPARCMAESTRQYTLCEMVRTVDAWLLWSVGLVQIGAGAVCTTNLAFIIQAARAPAHLVTSTGTTFGTGNLLGRLITPVASDVLLVRHGLPRPWLLLLLCLTQALGHFGLLLAATPGVEAGGAAQQALLVSGAGMSGLAFGAMWPSLVILASELFGRSHLQTNYMFFDGCCARRPPTGTCRHMPTMPHLASRDVYLASRAVHRLGHRQHCHRQPLCHVHL